MLSTHVIELTRRVVIGSGVLGRLTEYLPRHLRVPGFKVFIVTGPHVWQAYSGRLVEALDNARYSIEVARVDSSDVEVAEVVADEVKRAGAHFVLGFGGGKSIDVAKYCASKIGVPFVSAPTAASHDGIASAFATLRGTEKPVSIKTVEPTVVVADIDVIASAPTRLLIAGAGDVIAKFTAVLDWKLAHMLRNEYYGEYSASLALLSAKHIVKYREVVAKNKIAGSRIVLEALISSSVAMGIAGSTRPASGSEHLFSHALDIVAERPALHGEQTGIGTIMMSKLHRMNWRKIRRVLREIGAPTTAKELGMPEEKIVEALTIAHTIRPDRYTILGTEGLTWDAAEKLAMETGVIGGEDF
ncbi:MAG: NAD(P)-dependent glycerol-1-phosphate dehydrogenase [Fervidicoccaceae archaeon]